MMEFILLTVAMFPNTEITWVDSLPHGYCGYITYDFIDNNLVTKSVEFSTLDYCNKWGVIGHEFKHEKCIEDNDLYCFYEVDGIAT